MNTIGVLIRNSHRDSDSQLYFPLAALSMWSSWHWGQSVRLPWTPHWFYLQSHQFPHSSRWVLWPLPRTVSFLEFVRNDLDFFLSAYNLLWNSNDFKGRIYRGEYKHNISAGSHSEIFFNLPFNRIFFPFYIGKEKAFCHSETLHWITVQHHIAKKAKIILPSISLSRWAMSFTNTTQEN